MHRQSLRSSLLAAVPFAAAVAGAAPCSPGYLAMHEFQVGDVFQYRAKGGYNFTKPVTTLDIRKVRIVSKSETSQSRIYVAEVLYRNQGFTDSGPLSVWTGQSLDTLAYLDSAGHSVNGCHGEVVPMPAPGWGLTRIEVGQGDTGWFTLASTNLRMKRFEERVLRPGDEIIDAPVYTVTYAEGLGAVRTAWGPGLTQPPSQTLLTGYIRNGARTGEVTPDQELLNPVSLHPSPPRDRTLHPEKFATLPQTTFDLRGRSLRRSGVRTVILDP